MTIFKASRIVVSGILTKDSCTYLTTINKLPHYRAAYIYIYVRENFEQVNSTQISLRKKISTQII